jgi:hypothetical protein
VGQTPHCGVRPTEVGGGGGEFDRIVELGDVADHGEQYDSREDRVKPSCFVTSSGGIAPFRCCCRRVFSNGSLGLFVWWRAARLTGLISYRVRHASAPLPNDRDDAQRIPMAADDCRLPGRRPFDYDNDRYSLGSVL